MNQIPYYYTEKETDRFKGLDLADRVPEELWMEVCYIVEQVVMEKVMAPHSSTLAGKSHGWRSLVGCHLWGRTESDPTEVT